MKVYRIERNTWPYNGPYCGYSATVSRNRYFGDRCPGPNQDGLDTSLMSYHHYFGFAKMKQMFTWFKARDIFKMRKEGFRVYRYKIADEHVCLGYSQLAFIRAKATVREEVKMSLMVRHLCSF